MVDGVVVAPLEMALSRKQRRRGLLKRDGIDGVMVFAGINAVHTIGMRFAIDVAFCGIEIAGHHRVLRVRTMQPRRRGHIIAISSAAVHQAFADCAGYTAAKAGQLGLMRVLAAEARPYEIRVTTVVLGATDTPIWDDRPGFDRARMMKADDVAGFLVAIVARPGIAVDEVTIMPPAGAL